MSSVVSKENQVATTTKLRGGWVVPIGGLKGGQPPKKGKELPKNTRAAAMIRAVQERNNDMMEEKHKEEERMKKVDLTLDWVEKTDLTVKPQMIERGPPAADAEEIADTIEDSASIYAPVSGPPPGDTRGKVII